MTDNGEMEKAPSVKNKGGRPTKLTPKVQEEVCSAIRAGNTFEAAASYGGISPASFYSYMDKGRQSYEKGRRRTKFTEFLEEVTRAKSVAEVALVANINKAGEKDWRAHAFLLERRNPSDWGRHDRLSANVTESGTVKKMILIKRLPDVKIEDPVKDDKEGDPDGGSGGGEE
jgi:hypothetical protein